MSDWAPGTKIRPTLINVTFDATGKIDHVGVGYALYLPSGKFAQEGGFTWTPSATQMKGLQTAADALANAVAADQGVTIDFSIGPQGVALTVPPPGP